MIINWLGYGAMTMNSKLNDVPKTIISDIVVENKRKVYKKIGFDLYDWLYNDSKISFHFLEVFLHKEITSPLVKCMQRGNFDS
jgi:hypothetical protein